MLTGARLRSATWVGADLSGAALADADLKGCDLTGAKLDAVELAPRADSARPAASTPVGRSRKGGAGPPAPPPSRRDA